MFTAMIYIDESAGQLRDYHLPANLDFVTVQLRIIDVQKSC